jgi:membrane-bound ClpP family serine protease
MFLYFVAIGLLLLGMCILVLELFIPSGGILGVLAALSFVASIVVAFFADPRFGALMLTGEVILIPTLIAIGVHFWPNTPLGRLILIPRPQSDDDILPDGEEYRELKTIVGKRGKAKTKMLPSGVVMIDGKTFDAVSQGMAIDPGEGVLVVAVRTNRIVVRPLDPNEVQPAEPADELLSRPVDAVVPDPFREPLA